MFENNENSNVYRKQLANKAECVYYKILFLIGYCFMFYIAVPHVMLHSPQLPQLPQLGKVLIVVTIVMITIVLIMEIMNTVKNSFELAIMYIRYKRQMKQQS